MIHGVPYRPTEKTRAQAAIARAAVLEAALEVLAEGGYAAASMSAIAKRAGLATGSVYRHFHSKADLFAEVFRVAAQREVDVLRGLRADTPEERLAPGGEGAVRAARPRRAGACLRPDRRARGPGGGGGAADVPARLRGPVRVDPA